MNTPRFHSLARRVRMALVGSSIVLAGAGLGLWLHLGGTSANATTAGAPAQQLKGTGDEVWGAKYFPNVVLTDQDGKKHRFFDDMLKGKVVAINFIFTSCASSCGLETARMREVQEILGDRVGKDVFFYSISIDPNTDTPEELKKYAGKFNADIPGWRFLTGKEADITLIRKKLGMYDELEDNAKNLNDHMLHLMLGNQATGRWMKGSPYENPQFTANQLGSWLHNYKTASPKETRYENAPTAVAAPSEGEKLYMHRCISCHTIDGSVGPSPRNIGPDLENLTARRSRAWLERWMKEPDRMLAEKDPIATTLYNQYNQVAMPNLKLDKRDIERVLAFIDEESKLPRKERKTAHR